MTSFLSEITIYAGRIRDFDRSDWMAYLAWVGLMCGLCASTGGLILFGHMHGVVFPACAYWVPVGALIFTISIAFDTIGHRTVYRAALQKGEGLVHSVTIFCGIGSCVFLSAAQPLREAMWIPAMVLTVLSFVYSLIDEAFHWRRYLTGNSDRVEMSSHVGILIGHGTMMTGWWQWFFGGYQGVSQTLGLWPS